MKVVDPLKLLSLILSQVVIGSVAYADMVPSLPSSGYNELAPQVPLAATLTFRSSTEIDGERLYLGNLAECQGMREICDEIYGVDLGPSPEPGRTVTWHPEKSRSILNKEWPNADIRLAGAKVIKITASAITLTDDRVESALVRVLSEAFGEDSALKVSVDKVLLPPGLKLRPADYVIDFPELTDEHLQSPDWVIRRLSGNIRLTFVARQVDGDQLRAVFSTATHLTVHALLPVLAKSLDKGAEISEENLSSEMVALGRGGSMYVSHRNELIGHRLRRPMPGGTPLLPSDVELPRLVRRGQMVQLKVDGSGVAVSGAVKVMADGVTGQVIEAQYPSTKKKMRVRVIDANTVQHVF